MGRNAKPVEKKNSAETIRKINQACERAIAATTDEQIAAYHVHVSMGNSKVGKTPNINLPPVFTCGSHCMECQQFCYAVRTFTQYPGCRSDWVENMLLALYDADRYFTEISEIIADRVTRDRKRGSNTFFRWHSSGDIMNKRYFAGMVQVARENPDCQFLAFTKQYEIVNAWIAENGLNAIPANLHIIMSAEPSSPVINPYHLPECHIQTADGTRKHCA